MVGFIIIILMQLDQQPACVILVILVLMGVFHVHHVHQELRLRAMEALHVYVLKDGSAAMGFHRVRNVLLVL
jgi:hypothetical protein